MRSDKSGSAGDQCSDWFFRHSYGSFTHHAQFQIRLLILISTSPALNEIGTGLEQKWISGGFVILKTKMSAVY